MELLSASEAAAFLGRHVRTLENYARTGRLTRHKKGNLTYYLRNELETLRREIAGESEPVESEVIGVAEEPEGVAMPGASPSQALAVMLRMESEIPAMMRAGVSQVLRETVALVRDAAEHSAAERGALAGRLAAMDDERRREHAQLQAQQGRIVELERENAELRARVGRPWWRFGR